MLPSGEPDNKHEAIQLALVKGRLLNQPLMPR